MKPTGIVRDPVFMMHDMGEYHPECPERLEIIYQMIDEFESDLNFVEIPNRGASFDEIVTNHDPRYVNQIAATAGRPPTFLDPDTSACAHSWEAASKAVGGLFNLVDGVIEGRVRNGFALVRPPGHHAERRRAMGFCFFNNVALAARHALRQHGLTRVAIVDWDLHHGNGTQNSFYEESEVLFISIHQYPHYPGTGGVREIGHGAGEGYTVNVPLASGAGDEEYLTVFHMLVAPILEAYKPQLILVSAGFDAHERDPLGGMALTESGYSQMLEILMHIAEEYCLGRLVLTLEGGYDLIALRESVKIILNVLSSYNCDKEMVPFQPAFERLSSTFRARLRDVLATQVRYWPNLSVS
ncbi:MAG: histone deacetylase [Desulfomonile tiedjei]|uniref:histone deacetylase n=1 Tax=Desulfomonile tiedjei TaxID=2358 RepID=A0A9D6Z5T9_9BACT|nr:histone deacetylase [Desulfomonile tiedjei]